jgi:hypothetical protein
LESPRRNIVPSEELSEQIKAAKESASDLLGRLAVELARDTHRNFFAGAMIAEYRAMRSGEGAH